jgi:hypothetical protein
MAVPFVFGNRIPRIFSKIFSDRSEGGWVRFLVDYIAHIALAEVMGVT